VNSQGTASRPTAPVRFVPGGNRRDLNTLSAAIVLVLALLFGLATPVLPPALLFAAPIGILLLYAGARWPCWARSSRWHWPSRSSHPSSCRRRARSRPTSC
jgi:hypothetical protein